MGANASLDFWHDETISHTLNGKAPLTTATLQDMIYKPVLEE